MPDFKFKKEISSPAKAVFWGDFDLRRLAVILNSRQSKTPVGNDPWVVGTVKAVKYAIDHDLTLVTSTGMNTWELVCWACGRQGGRQIVVYLVKKFEDIDKIATHIVSDFELDYSQTGWLLYEATSGTGSGKVDWPIRDRLAIARADEIIPISVRSGGNLEQLIAGPAAEQKTIIKDFQVKYQVKKYYRDYRFEEIKTAFPRQGWDYITHWTRTCHGRWPGESSAAFYNKLVNSAGRYPHDGFASLKNILSERKIRASANNLRRGVKAVAFSSLHPRDVIPLMRWRKRYVRWNFEPYGIAISRQAAIKAGIKPVIYGKPGLYERLVDADKPYFQSEGMDGGDWREENEWRYLGDFDLASLDSNELITIVHNRHEINAIRDITDSAVLAIE